MLRNSALGEGQMALAFGPERRVYGVSELNAEIQGLFERQFRSIWVAGEISGCRTSAAGHYYFNLKDGEAQVKCALFKGAARFAKFRPQDGLAVIVRGTLEVYAPRGEFQLVAELLEPRGAGALQVAFEQLKKKLAAEGLFAAERKRPLPRLPRRIGLVTSQAGAVLRDMIHVLSRRFPGLHIRLFPAQVQGEGSVEQICQGLRHFSQPAAEGKPWAEVVIVARGGGSIEDLWSFNEEAVARAVAASQVPVISAVGHETDFTICDFVADYRAPTPSAAAEIVICTRQSLFEQLANLQGKFTQALRFRVMTGYRRLESSGAERTVRLLMRKIANRTQMLDEVDHRLRRACEARLGERRARLAALASRLSLTDLRLRIARNVHRNQQLIGRLAQIHLVAGRSQRVSVLETSITRLMQTRSEAGRRRWEAATAHLSQLSPLAVLQRGYAIVRDAEGHVVRAAEEVSLDDRLQVRLNRGELNVIVSE